MGGGGRNFFWNGPTMLLDCTYLASANTNFVFLSMGILVSRALLTCGQLSAMRGSGKIQTAYHKNGLDFARVPRCAQLTVCKKGSGYENEA